MEKNGDINSIIKLYQRMLDDDEWQMLICVRKQVIPSTTNYKYIN